MITTGLALAAGSGISQLDSGFTTGVNVGRVIAAIIAVALLVHLIANYAGVHSAQNRNPAALALAFAEFLGIAVCVIFATNPSVILGLFGVSGAITR